MPLAVFGATIVTPPHMPCEPANSREMAAILCMPGVWGVLESNWEGLIMRTLPWTLDGVSRIGCSVSFVLTRVTPFVCRGVWWSARCLLLENDLIRVDHGCCSQDGGEFGRLRLKVGAARPAGLCLGCGL